MKTELKEISVLDCETFEEYPFQVKDDETMDDLVQSIQRQGAVTLPVLPQNCIFTQAEKESII